MTIATLMLALAQGVVSQLGKKSVLVLDAYFAVGSTFTMARECLDERGERLLHVITRAKQNAVGYRSYANDTGRFDGRVKLCEQFETRTDDFIPTEVTTYGVKKSVSYLCLDLFWKPIGERLRFVLVRDGDDTCIFSCSNLAFSPECRQSSTERAIGFSHSTCLPRSSAAREAWA